MLILGVASAPYEPPDTTGPAGTGTGATGAGALDGDCSGAGLLLPASPALEGWLGAVVAV
jgi:hypothetical protein